VPWKSAVGLAVLLRNLTDGLRAQFGLKQNFQLCASCGIDDGVQVHLGRKTLLLVQMKMK
jgi:hypothetical protein